MIPVDAASMGAALFVKASLILLAGWVLALTLRRRSAALRHRAWRIALLSVLVLPLLTEVMPPLDDDWQWRLVHDSDDGDEIVWVKLSGGTNTVEIAYREDGAHVDRFFITNDPYTQPEDAHRPAPKVEAIFID